MTTLSKPKAKARTSTLSKPMALAERFDKVSSKKMIHALTKSRREKKQSTKALAEHFVKAPRH